MQASYATESVDTAAPLDCMLGSLTAEMNRQGVNTTQKGCCTACDKAIVGQVITALGKTWHPEHFTCTHCSQELGTRNFFERDGRPYCEPDYHNLFSPRCAYCNGPILDVRIIPPNQLEIHFNLHYITKFAPTTLYYSHCVFAITL